MTDYIRRCSIEDQNLLALSEVDTGPYQKQKYGYRKRTGLCKLVVKQPFVETKIPSLVRTTAQSTILLLIQMF